MPARHRIAAAAAAAGAIATLGGAVAYLGLAAAPAAPAAVARPAGSAAYLSHFSTLTTIASTVPGNGDQNPYGVFVIQQSTGRLQAGNVLVSNFNNAKNLQGTGKTIVEVTPGGQRTTFARINPSKLPGSCPGGVGLTTALEVLPGGWVVVGSTPSRNGQAATAKAGCLLVLNSNGKVKETISGYGINGPWDSAAVVRGRFAYLFVTNVLNGTVAAGGKVVHDGYVLRLKLRLHRAAPPSLVASTVIAKGYPQRTDSVAFILGPTGVGLSQSGKLYVAETLTSRIFAISDAVFGPGSLGQGALVTKGGKLNMPLGLAIAPNGHVLTVNGGDGRIVETTPAGAQIFSRYLDMSGFPPGAGALFGLAVTPYQGGVYYVDDATNTLNLFH
jgi:hypothetical protein